MAGKKVLVADDEVHIVHVVAIKLRNNGFEVITAENGQEGWELACSEKPDIVVTDFQMPLMTGLELVESMRSNPDTENIPVIMLTARGFEIEQEQRQSLNISDCLSKPFSPRELLERINEVLSESVPA